MPEWRRPDHNTAIRIPTRSAVRSPSAWGIAVALLLLPAPAVACRCVSGTDWRAAADLIVDGTIVAIGEKADAFGDRLVRLQVKRVIKGKAAETIEFRAAHFRESSCGIGLFAGQEGQFLLGRTSGGYATNFCLMLGAGRQ